VGDVRIRAVETIGDSDAALALFAPALIGLSYETLHVAHLDDDRTLLKLTALAGAPDRVELPLRPLIAEALALGATALIVAHNHPGGTASPSRADIVATRRLVEVARPLQIELLDHLIFAGETVVSFRALGLL